MRRVLRYLRWEAGWWRDRVASRKELAPAVAAGVRAYALKKAAWDDRIAGFFRTKWDVPAQVALQQLSAGAELDDFLGQ